MHANTHMQAPAKHMNLTAANCAQGAEAQCGRPTHQLNSWAKHQFTFLRLVYSGRPASYEVEGALYVSTCFSIACVCICACFETA